MTRALRLTVPLLLAAGAFLATGQRLRAAPEPATPPFDFYDGRAYYEQPVPYQTTPEGLKSLTAESCGACHTAIYEEWRTSTHAHAWVDPQFQAEMHKTPAVGWLCLGCHTPLLNQQPEYVVALDEGRIDKPVTRPNPAVEPAFRDEGVGCATCHVRDGAVLGPYGNRNAPHAVRYAPQLREAETCLRCHQATTTYKTQNLVCVFRTGEEWRAGPYDDEGVACQGCHMPEATRPVAKDGPPRAGRTHYFAGSRIPKLVGEHFEAAHPALRNFPDGLAVGAPTAKRTERGVEVSLEIANANAGHRLPTGDPERFITVDLALTDAQGRALAATQEWIGSKYQWWPTTRLLSDNRLAPRETRTLTLRYEGDVPPGPLSLRVVATKHRMSEEAARYHDLLGRYPISRTFIETTYAIP